MAMLRHPIYLPADLLEALAQRTGHFWSTPDNEAIVIDAVRAWMNPASAVPARQPAGRSEAGYQWKQVFLPEGTRLRASFGGQAQFAEVDGAEIKYGGYTVSPSAFANLHGSGNRNAWKAVWLRFPGSDEWLLADVCRLARNAAIARMIGDDAQQARQRAQTSPGQRQGKGKRKSRRRPRAGGSAARQPIAAPQQTAERQFSAAAHRNDTPSKDDARRDGRRKRRVTKHAT